MSGVFSSVRLSVLISESTIYQMTASTIAQGYLEQIKGLPYEEVLLASQDPLNYSLETKSPTYDVDLNATVLDTPISLDSSQQPISRDIMIDVRNSDVASVIKMPMKFLITIDDKNSGTDPINALEIKILYSYQLPNVLGGEWREKQVQAIRTRM